MEVRPSYIRLFVATAAATVSVVFVAVYSGLSVPIVRARDHIRFEMFPQYAQWLAQFCWCALLVPACFFAAGLLVLARWKNKTAFELAVGCQWLFALAWLALSLLVWLLPQVPYSE